jgi:hypothetical protein
MWRSFPSIDRARAPMAATIAAALIVMGCAQPEEKVYGLYDPIEMGPWVFQVTGAKGRTENRGIRLKVISVSLELENYQERHEKPFDDFLNGRKQNSALIRPKIWLVSDAGKKFDGSVSPKSGGSMRSKRWNVAFELVEFSMRENSSDTAKRYFDSQPADFRLVIQNPDRREGQPREVAIQLP